MPVAGFPRIFQGHFMYYVRETTLVWKRYGHLYPGSTRAAAAALDRHLKAIAS